VSYLINEDNIYLHVCFRKVASVRSTPMLPLFTFVTSLPMSPFSTYVTLFCLLFVYVLFATAR